MNGNAAREEILKLIAASLKDPKGESRCIVLLGPEMPFLGNGTRYDNLRNFLKDKPYGTKVGLDEQDDLLSLKGLALLERQIFFADLKEFYEQLPVTKTYEQIVELPFHTIVSLSPDNLLRRVFESKKAGKPEYYNYQQINYNFTKTDPAQHHLAKPTQTQPLIYNLMGCVEEAESLALDYDRFFDFILAVNGADNLSKVLREQLAQAQTLIFVGFRLEKWYFKLLIRILGLHEKKVSLSPREDLGPDSVTVYQNHFGFEFIEMPAVEFLSHVHAYCKSHGLLRENFTPKSQREVFDEMMYRFDLEVVVRYLMHCLEKERGTDLYDTLSTALAQLETAKRKSGIDSSEEGSYQKVSSRLHAVVLQYREKLKS